MKLFKKIIRSLSVCLALVLCFTTIGQRAVFAQETKSNKINIVHDGKNYRVEPEVKDNGNVVTKIYTDEKLTDVMVYNKNTGKVIDNGKEVAFINEASEEAPTLSQNAAKLAAGDILITPNSVTPPGDYGGGEKIFLSRYTAGFTSRQYSVVLGVCASIVAMVAAYLEYKYDKSVSGVMLLVGISTMLSSQLNYIIINHTYYVASYYTGYVGDYARTLQEFYSDSSYNWTAYTGCTWADQRMY